jgi:imidazolonepropionase-like amidohydrolase
VSVTSTAARVLGLDGEIGLLARGKKADILVVADDPLEDISVLQREEKILAVFKEGRPVVDRGLSS